MTKAASEPLFSSPLSERLGYLAHAINAIDIGSPDTLHGAAHYAPLTGLYLPILDLLADYNDSVIEAGQSANIEALKCMRAATRNWLVAEQTRLQADNTPVVEYREDHEHILNELRWRGEVTAAAIALSCAPKEMQVPLSNQFQQLLTPASSSGDEKKDAFRQDIGNEILQALESGNLKIAQAQVAQLLQHLTISPFDTF